MHFDLRAPAQYRPRSPRLEQLRATRPGAGCAV